MTSPNVGGGGGGGGGGGVSSLTRAAIPSNNLTNVASIVLNGYRSANDFGFGAPYTCVGQSSTSWNAIQDSAGNWCALNLGVLSVVNAGWFGAYCTGNSQPISAGDISAHPEWRGVYTAGVEWDAVSMQEGTIAAFGGTSTPNHIVWNVNTGSGNNLEFYVPPGTNGGGPCLINKQILTVANFGKITFNGKGQFNGTSSLWRWTGPQNVTMWLCNSCAYMQIFSPSVGSASNGLSNDGTQACLWVLDHASSPGGLLTQQNTIYDALINVPTNGRGACVNPVSGGGGQGDTVTWINPVVLGQGAISGIELAGQNTLEHVIINGDFQFFNAGCAIVLNGGQVATYGTHFENQNYGVNGGQFSSTPNSPIITQFTTNGGDICVNSGVSNSINSVHNARSEGDIIIKGTGGGISQFDGLSVLSVDRGSWFGSTFPFLQGVVMNGGTKGRAFMLVDNIGVAQGTVGNAGSNAWRSMVSCSGCFTVTDPGSPGYAVNAFVGYDIHFRFASSDGFTFHCPINANTANTITVGATCNSSSGLSPSSDSLYQIGQVSAASPPAWDSAAKGYRFNAGNGQGVTTTVGSNIICMNSGPTPTVGDYLMIPGADKITPGGTVYTFPLYAKVTAVSGTSCTGGNHQATVARAAQAALSNVDAWGGTPINDNGNQWIDFEYSCMAVGAGMANNISCPGLAQVGNATLTNYRPSRPDWLDPGSAGSFVNAVTLFNGMRTDQIFNLGTTSGTIDLTNAMQQSSLAILTPSGATTLNAPLEQQFTQDWTILLNLGSGTYSLLFGTNFVSNGPVASISAAGGRVAVTFRSSIDGKWYEISRNAFGPNSYPFLYSAAGTPLPTCGATTNPGAQTTVSDATAPTYNGAYVSGGTITTPVVCDASTNTWRTH